MAGKRRVHYTRRIATELCEAVAMGCTIEKALAKVDCGVGRAPSLQTFYNWLEAHPEFREMYERARVIQADLQADRIMTMADEVLAKPQQAQAFKVASDILRWQAEVRNPRKYGAKVQHHIEATLNPATLRDEIARLEKDLGVAITVTPITTTPPSLPAPGDSDEQDH
jgi:hypothetical protein